MFCCSTFTFTIYCIKNISKFRQRNMQAITDGMCEFDVRQCIWYPNCVYCECVSRCQSAYKYVGIEIP